MKSILTNFISKQLTPLLFVLILLPFTLNSSYGMDLLSYKQPDITLKGISLGEITKQHQTLVVTLAITNPNDISLPIHDIVMDFTANDISFGKAQGTKPVTLKAHETTDVPLRLSLNIMQSLTQIPLLLSKPQLTYSLKGKAHVMGVIPFPFEKSGVLNLR